MCREGAGRCRGHVGSAGGGRGGRVVGAGERPANSVNEKKGHRGSGERTGRRGKETVEHVAKMTY